VPYQIAQDTYIFQSCIWQTNSCVILNEAANIIIDPCYFPVEIQVIEDFVSRRKSFNKYIIFTHSDFDHIVGYQYFKGAKLLGHGEMARCDREAQVLQAREIDQTYYINRKTPFLFPELDLTFASDFRVPLKGDELALFHAPGHTADSIFIVSTAKRVLFAGDYLSDLEFPFIYFDSGAYSRTLELAEKIVRDFQIEIVVPGHGELAKGREEIFERINNDKEYLANLLENAQDLCFQGLQEKEITEVLKGIKYRNEPIEGSMLKMHEENIRLILKEIQSF